LLGPTTLHSKPPQERYPHASSERAVSHTKDWAAAASMLIDQIHPVIIL